MGQFFDARHGGERQRVFYRAAVLAAALVLALLVPVVPRTEAPTAEAASKTPSCGTTVARRYGGGNWKCTFSEYFSGNSLDRSVWSALTTADSPAVTQECRVDDPANIRVLNGTLRLTVRKLSSPMICPSPWGAFVTEYTAGGVTTRYGFSQTRGRFQIRARFPSAKIAGLHSAIWMWPKNRSYGKYSGELDIAEFRTASPDIVVPSIHYFDDGTAGRKTAWDCKVTSPQNFHTYTFEWTQTQLIFLYDDKPCLYHAWKAAAPLSNPQPFDHPFFLILNQSLGIGENAYDGSVPLPATMQVDFVRAWS